MSARVLIVEDEVELGQAMAWAFCQHGFETVLVHGGKAALRELSKPTLPDLVLLDLMLPDLPGEEVARTIRGEPDTARLPIIIVSAKDSEIDRVVGLAIGADDYVAKPFSTRELVLRAKAIVRRTSPGRGRSSPTQVGPLRIDPQAHQAWVEGEPLELTALEHRLLATFVERRGQVLTREELLDSVWGTTGGELTLRAVDARIKALRRKLLQAADLLETVRGVGYRFGARGAS